MWNGLAREWNLRCGALKAFCQSDTEISRNQQKNADNVLVKKEREKYNIKK